MRGRRRLCVAAAALLCRATCGADDTPVPHNSLWTPILAWPDTVLPVSELVARAHRPSLVSSLAVEEYTCTSLSGPTCLWASKAQPQTWANRRHGTEARVAAAVTPQSGQQSARPASASHSGLDALQEDGTGTVFALPFTPAAFHGLLSGGGDWLVLFLTDFSACGPACGAAVSAVRAAAPQLSVSGVRFVAVLCDPGSPFARTCTKHGVTDTPQLRLYFGTPQLGVLFDGDLYQRRSRRARTVAGDADLDEEDDSDDGDEESSDDSDIDAEEDVRGDSVRRTTWRNSWDGASIVAFHQAHSTPLARSLLAEARNLLRDWLGDSDGLDDDDDEVTAEVRLVEQKSSADADDVEPSSSSSSSSDDGDGDEEGGEDAESAARRSAATSEGQKRTPFRQAVQDALEARLGDAPRDDGIDEGAVPAGGGRSTTSSLAEFRKNMEALLKDHHKRSPQRASEPPNGMTRSLPSKTKRKLHLVNARGEACDAMWVDFQGVERPFARIQPGRTATLSTFTSHLWRIRDANNGAHVAFVLVSGRSAGGEEDAMRFVIT